MTEDELTCTCGHAFWSHLEFSGLGCKLCHDCDGWFQCCICGVMQLWNTGCRCGALEYERAIDMSKYT